MPARSTQAPQPPAAPRPGPSPRLGVAAELLRALGGAALLPVRTLGYLLAHDRLRADLEDDLDHPASVAPDPSPRAFPDRPLRVFVSCAEASGELHAKSFVRELSAELERHAAPAPVVHGIGGPRLAADGVRIVGDPVSRAAMGFDGVLSALPFYLGLLTDAARAFRDEAYDLCVPVDSPALHVPLARLARRASIPVVHFITPQYWGWAPWRVGGYRAAVDRALTILPFEPPWFARHGVPHAHVGHPLLDQLETVVPIDPEPPGRRLVLLPGSREKVVERNLPWMLRVAARLRESDASVEPVVVHELTELEPDLRRIVAEAGLAGSVEVVTGDLHGALAGARAALSVSGTVLLDLLHHRLPAVVIYRLGRRRETWMYRHLLTAPHFASVNLLAGEEVYPEHCFTGAGPLEQVTLACERALVDPEWRARCRAGLERAAARLGPPGSAARAVRQALALAVPARGESGVRAAPPDPSRRRRPAGGAAAREAPDAGR